MRVVLDGVTKSFGATEVLSRVDFDEEVRALALIGPSGGGKSTLLRIVGGLLEPSAGEVSVGGEPLPRTEAARVAYRRRLGFVFQQGGLFDHLSARENIALPLVCAHGAPRAQAEARADELLGRLGLSAAADKRPAALSGGQRQRVAIARAVAAKPRLLLLDEPTSALDPEYTGEVLDVVAELKAEGVDFVIVTHEMGFARRACDTVAFLCDGTIKESGPSEDVFADPRTEELRRFLGKMLEWR